METGQAYDRLGLHGDLIPGAILHAGAMLLGMEWSQTLNPHVSPRKEWVFWGSRVVFGNTQLWFACFSSLRGSLFVLGSECEKRHVLPQSGYIWPTELQGPPGPLCKTRGMRKYGDWKWGSLPKWVWVNTYRYIFSGMNIHLPAILGFTRYQGFDPSPNDNLNYWNKWWKPPVDLGGGFPIIFK